jgi:phospholipid transport system substrate-binding protein
MDGRRSVLGSLILVCALVVALATPAAATPEGARDFIRSLGDEAVAALSDDSLSEEARTEELRQLFARGFDIRTIAFFALGRHWRGASKQQLREYLALFTEFIVTSYAERFGEYAGEILKVKGSRKGSGGDVMVMSDVVQPGKPALRVDWRVRQTNRGYKIVDVIVEGVSMLITQRDEFTAVIRSKGKGIEGLLAALREKTGTPSGARPPHQDGSPDGTGSSPGLADKRVGLSAPNQ